MPHPPSLVTADRPAAATASTGPSSTSEADDENLVAAARGGHDDALSTLVDRYRPMVLGMASERFLPGGDRDDLVQEGMIGLWHAIRDHDARRGPFGPFARLCVDRQMWAAVTRANRLRHKALCEAAPYEDWMDVADSGPDPEQLALAADGIRALTAYMHAALSDLEHDVLRLYAAGQSYDAIALALEVHRKRIDNALQRARRKLGAFTEAHEGTAA